MSSGRILVVCTGNVCRSPLVERALQAALDDRWGPAAVQVRSAGTHALVGSPIEPLAVEHLGPLGGRPDGFAARRLEAGMVRDADLVLTASRRHRSAVVQLHPPAMRYTFTLLDLADMARHLAREDLPDTDDAVEWLRQVTATMAARRGMTPPLSAAAAELVDPYRRERAVYEQLGRELAAALPGVAWLLTGRR